MGMRRDTNVGEKNVKVRVGVVGDSHIDGVCNNPENVFGELVSKNVICFHRAARVRVEGLQRAAPP